MNRRGFFQALFGGAAAAVIPEKKEKIEPPKDDGLYFIGVRVSKGNATHELTQTVECWGGADGY